MSETSLKVNYLYRLVYEIIILIIPFVTTPYISRVLGVDGVGDYSFTYSVITYFMLFGALGTLNYGAREIARVRDDRAQTSKVFWEIELMTVGTALVCLLVWVGFIVFGGRYSLLFLALTPFLLGTMFDISWFFTGLERVKNIVIRNSLIKIIGIVLLFLMVKTKDDLILYCIINSCASLAGNLSMWFYLPKMLVKVDPGEFRFSHHLHETIAYFIPTIAVSIYTVLDKTLIGLITGSSAENGYYEQATKIIRIVKSVVFLAMNSVMTARMSYLYAEERFDEIKEKLAKSLDMILLLGVGSVFGLLGISHRFVPVFFGAGYGPVEGLIYLMTPLIIIIGVSNCLEYQYYTPSGKRALSAKFVVSGAGINLILNICLIPFFNSQGAVVASIIAELVITGLYLKFCDGYLAVPTILKMLWKRVIAGVFMAPAVYGLGLIEMNGIVAVILQIVCGIAVYCIVLAVLKDKMLFELFGLVSGKHRRINKRED